MGDPFDDIAARLEADSPSSLVREVALLVVSAGEPIGFGLEVSFGPEGAVIAGDDPDAYTVLVAGGEDGRSVEAQFVDRTGATVAEAAFTGFPAHTVARTLTVQYLNVTGGLST